MGCLAHHFNMVCASPMPRNFGKEAPGRNFIRWPNSHSQLGPLLQLLLQLLLLPQLLAPLPLLLLLVSEASDTLLEPLHLRKTKQGTSPELQRKRPERLRTLHESCRKLQEDRTLRCSLQKKIQNPLLGLQQVIVPEAHEATGFFCLVT